MSVMSALHAELAEAGQLPQPDPTREDMEGPAPVQSLHVAPTFGLHYIFHQYPGTTNTAACCQRPGLVTLPPSGDVREPGPLALCAVPVLVGAPGRRWTPATLTLGVPRG